MKGIYLINFVKNNYNSSSCDNVFSSKIHKIQCQQYLYTESYKCCNDYIKENLKLNEIIDVCYNNNNINYSYECNYVSSFNWYLFLLSFMFILCFCSCFLVIKCKKDEKEEERRRLISYS